MAIIQRLAAVLATTVLTLSSLPAVAEAVTPAPVITSLSRTSGPYAGAVTVHIYGRYLSGVSRISFGGVNGIKLRRISTRHLVIWTPALPAGLHKVRVVSSHGISKPKLYRAINDGRASMVGRVTDRTSGEPRPDVSIFLNTTPNNRRSTFSLTTGFYRFVGITPGAATVCVLADHDRGSPPTGYVDTCYPNWVNGRSIDRADAPTLKVRAGAMSRASFPLIAGAQVRGRVIDAMTGKPLADAYVTVVNTNDKPRWRYDLDTTTASDGTFTVQGIAAAHYAICAFAKPGTYGTEPTYVPSCYPYAPWRYGMAAPASASSFSLSSGTVVSRTVALRVGGHLSLGVTGADTGAALAGVTVKLASAHRPADYYQTASNGRILSDALPAGVYTICFGAGSTANAIGAPYYSICRSGVSVALGRTTTITQALRSPGELYGTLSASGNASRLSGVAVYVFTAHGNLVANTRTGTGSGGWFAFLPAGTYHLCFDVPDSLTGPAPDGYYDQCDGGTAWDPSDTNVPTALANSPSYAVADGKGTYMALTLAHTPS